MNERALLRFGAVAAVAAGSLRIVSSFIAYSDPTTVAQELFYLVIDLCILYGLLAVYFFQLVEVGPLGFVGFLLALSGGAIIVGPDGSIGDVSMYRVGSGSLLLGLTLISVAGWRAARLPRYALVSWILSTVLAVLGSLSGASAILFLLAGVAFGVGFVGAGARIWSASSAS
jgi:hypothetical protein